MRSVPITTQMLIAFGIATLLPISLFLLTLMSLSGNILKKLAGVFCSKRATPARVAGRQAPKDSPLDYHE